MARKPTKKQVVTAIHDSGGIIDEIARRLGVSWATARAKVNKWPDVKELYDAENERVLDLAETTVLNSIKGGDTHDAKWLLARKGKTRGYGDNVDITSGNEKVTEIGVKLIDYRVGIADIEEGSSGDSKSSSKDKSAGDGTKVG